jgi:hypothetical protein
VAILVGAAMDAGGTAAETPSAAQRPVQRPDAPPVVLAFGGDVHFEGGLESKLATNAAGMLDPIEPVFRRADLAVVNLETAVTNAGAPSAKTFVFRTPASAFAALRGGGVDVASLANNHGLDYGLQGLRDTLAAARSYRFPVIGIGVNARQAYRPFRRTIDGQRIAVIGATQVLDDHLISSWTAGPGKPGLASAKDVPRLLRRSAPRAGPPTRSSCTCTGASSWRDAPRRISAPLRSSWSPRAPMSSSAGMPIGSRAPAAWARRWSATASATSSGTARASSRRRPASCS